MREFSENTKGSDSQQGFTLIEIMIVVAIISILAAIAIPNFLRYQLKSKTAEAKQNIRAIRTLEEAFGVEYDYYLPCGPMPAVAKNGKQPWTQSSGRGFDIIGFEPSGNVYYSYGVAAQPVRPSVALTAVGFDAPISGGALRVTGTVDIWINSMGDLDGDGNPGGFARSDEDSVIYNLAAGKF